jgi:hypothetical protein
MKNIVIRFEKLIIILIFLILSIQSACASVSEFSYVGGTATASSTLTIYVPSNAFDNSGATFWSSQSPSVYPEWLKFDFGAGTSHTVSAYNLTARTTPTVNSPKDWKFLGSTDATNWIVLDNRTNIAFTSGQTKIFDKFTSAVNISSFRYYRIHITNVISGADTAQIAEEELWGDDSGANTN